MPSNLLLIHLLKIKPNQIYRLLSAKIRTACFNWIVGRAIQLCDKLSERSAFAPLGWCRQSEVRPLCLYHRALCARLDSVEVLLTILKTEDIKKNLQINRHTNRDEYRVCPGPKKIKTAQAGFPRIKNYERNFLVIIIMMET